MYTIFSTINCVEQLTFSKTFVDQLQFEQLILFFCLKVKLLKIHVRQMILDFWAVDKKVTFAQMVSSKWKIVSSRFFEQTNFEQMIMTCFEHQLCLVYLYQTKVLQFYTKKILFIIELNKKSKRLDIRMEKLLLIGRKNID